MKRYIRGTLSTLFLGLVAIHATAAVHNISENNTNRGYVETFNQLRNDNRPKEEKCSLSSRASNLATAWYAGTRAFIDYYDMDEPWYALITAGALPYIGVATAMGADRAHALYCNMPSPPGPTPKDNNQGLTTPDVREFELRSLPRAPQERLNI